MTSLAAWRPLSPVRADFGPRSMASIAALVVVAWLVALIAGVVHLWASWLLAGVVGIALVFVPGIGVTEVAAALVIAGVVGESGLVPAAGRNHPMVVLAIPLVAWFIATYWGRWWEAVRPAWPVGLSSLAYIAVVAVWGLIQLAGRHLGASYVAATVALGLLLGLVVIPSLLRTPAGRRAVVVALACLGPVLAAVEVATVISGPIRWAGGFIGTWVFVQLKVLGQAVPVVFARVTGPFAQPAGAATVFAISLIALVALWPSIGRARRPWAVLAFVVDVVGLAITQNRDGWLIALVGGAVLLGVALLRGRRDAPALALTVLFGVMLVALSLNLVGADIRTDQAARYYGATVAATIPGADESSPVQIRGGSSLTGRDGLWIASVRAIERRPVLGWGLAQDQAAIAPLLPDGYQRFAGLTSDSLWLKTGVETGLLGLATLIAFCLAVLVAMARRIRWATSADVDVAALAGTAGFVALLAGGTFETYLLGGLTFPSFELALFAGIAVGVSGVGGRLVSRSPDASIS